MYSIKVFSIVALVAIFLGCALANVEETSAASSVKFTVFGASSVWWVAVRPQNDNGATTKVEVKDGVSSSFEMMQFNGGWGFYSLTARSANGFKMPLTFRFTSSSGAQITSQVTSLVLGAVVDTGAQYGESSPATPTASADYRRPTTAPTTAPTRSTTAPTTAPTRSTTAPTTAPVRSTTAPTTAPTRSTTAPSTNLCGVVPTSQEPLVLLVPLYVYPGAAWDDLIAAASQVKIIAIINPNSGPLSAVDSTYATYMNKLYNAGIQMVGYVHTSYGARSINDVKVDIDRWASIYQHVSGIFFDEAATAASLIPYYTQAYNYVRSKSGYTEVILNPGAQPDTGYLSISTNIVIYEDSAANLNSVSFGSWVTCAPSQAAKAGYKYRFSAIVHSAASGYASIISNLQNKGVGLVFVTDGAGGCCTYNAMPSYFTQEAAAVAALN